VSKTKKKPQLDTEAIETIRTRYGKEVADKVIQIAKRGQSLSSTLQAALNLVDLDGPRYRRMAKAGMMRTCM
jgi:hypothetical protein